MDDKYVVIKMDGYVSEPMTQEKAIEKAKEYDQEGISAYIASEEEGIKIRNNGFNMSNFQ